MKTLKMSTRSDGADAFVPEPGHNALVPDDLAEYLGETFVNSATGGEAPDEDDDLDAQSEAVAAEDSAEEEDEAVLEIDGGPKKTAKRGGAPLRFVPTFPIRNPVRG